MQPERPVGTPARRFRCTSRSATGSRSPVAHRAASQRRDHRRDLRFARPAPRPRAAARRARRARRRAQTSRARPCGRRAATCRSRASGRRVRAARRSRSGISPIQLSMHAMPDHARLAERQAEHGAQVVLELGGLAAFDGPVAGVVHARRQSRWRAARRRGRTARARTRRRSRARRARRRA